MWQLGSLIRKSRIRITNSNIFNIKTGDVEVPAITSAIEAHQRRITQAVLDHALKICAEKKVGDRFIIFDLLYFSICQIK